MNKQRVGLILSSLVIIVLVVTNVWFYTVQQNQISNMQGKLDDLEISFSNYTSTHSYTDSKYDLLVKEKATLETQLSANTSYISSLESQIEDLQDEIANQNAQIASLTDSLDNVGKSFEVQINQYLSQIASLNTQIEYLTKELKIAQSSQPIQEKVRDSVMLFIQFKHGPETLQYMQNLTWTGGRITPNLVGAETYRYTGNGWNFTMKYPIVPSPIYEITVEFRNSSLFIDWQGTWQNWQIAETHYSFSIFPGG